MAVVIGHSGRRQVWDLLVVWERLQAGRRIRADYTGAGAAAYEVLSEEVRVP